MANQISSNIIISQSKINKITAEYHSIFRPQKKAIQIPEISKAEFDGHHYLNSAKGAKRPSV
jgi:hypothetical protein